ncbi:hypothetical protein BHE74_00021329 [Ensete ventricosum]|nr:hypothetical protein BHE74_00021329 [Ensete ventricosum]
MFQGFPYRSVPLVPGGTYRSAKLPVCRPLATGWYRQNRSSTVDFDYRRSIEREMDCRRSIEGEKGKKKKRKRRKKKKNTSRRPRSRAVAACGSPVSRRYPRAIFLLRKEKDRGDIDHFLIF